MARGGARNRSGPPPQLRSARSDARGLSFTALPAKGFDGEMPEFPFPAASVRELSVWRELWRTPQAAVWAVERWRVRTVAHYTRWSVRAEDPECPATVLGQVHRLADQLGLTPAGLKENGWQIAATEAATVAVRPEEPKAAPVRRLRAVGE